MAIFHLTVKIVGRSKGKSIIAASAYLNGTVMKDMETRRTSYYTSKSEVVYSSLMMCQNAPPEWDNVPDENVERFKNSFRYKRAGNKEAAIQKFVLSYQKQKLWNEVLKVEKESNAQLGRSLEFSLPNEWNRQEQIVYTTDYIQRNFVAKGMCADWSIHDKGDGNPHVHLLLTMRPFNENHSWGNKEVKDWEFERDEQNRIIIKPAHPNWWQDKKNSERHGIRIPILDTDGNQKVDARNRKQWKRVTVDATGWNNPKNCELWRSEWAKECNLHLPKDKGIDHRSFTRQGRIAIPTIHEGTDARKIEAKYQTGENRVSSWKVEKNKIIKQQNALLQKIQKAFGNIADMLIRWKGILDDIRRKQRSRSHDGRNDCRVRGTAETDAGLVSGTGTQEPATIGTAGTKSAMERISGEVKHREQVIADTERRITEIKQRIEKAGEMNERFRKLTARRTATGLDESVRRATDGNRGQGQNNQQSADATERITAISREAQQREQERKRAGIKERLAASKAVVAQRDRESEHRKQKHRGYER